MGRIAAFSAGLLWTLAALASAAPPPSQPWFERLRVADGLPSGAVYTLRQDAAGFIWIGTRDGLARYDGVDFRIWRHDPADPASLSGNDVSAVLVDREGRVWCGGEGSGLNQLGADGRFRHYRHAAGDPHSLGSDDIFALAEDADGTIWVGTYLGGLNRLRAEGGFERIEHDADNPASLRSTTVISLAADASGRLWIGTDDGLDLRHRDGSLVHVALPGLDEKPGKLQINSLRAEADGSMLVGSDQGVVRVGADLRIAEVIFTPPARMPTMGVVAEAGSAYWIATTAGLWRVDGEERQRFGGGDTLPGDLPSTRSMDILRDREGGLWIALLDGGIARLPARWRGFSVWRHRPGQEASLQHTGVDTVSVDDEGHVWVGSGRDGIDRIDARSGVVERLGSRLHVGGSALRSLLRIGKTLWVGHFGGIRRYRLDDASVIELPVAEGSGTALPNGFVNHLLRTPDGQLWASLRGGGVSRIDPDSLAIRTWTVAAGGLADADIAAMVLDAQGRPWLASSSGVVRFDPASDRFVAVPGAPSESIDALAFDGAERLWLHRLGRLERYRVVDGRLEPELDLGGREGWPAMQVSDLHVDAEHVVWAASLRGLWRVDAAQASVRQFSERDGLPSAELVGSFAASDDGIVRIGTRAGVVAFMPSAIRLDSPPPPLQLTALDVNRDGQRLTLDPARPLQLRHDDRELSVSVRALSFLNPAGNAYHFRLDGFDKDWVDTGARGERVFSQLPAGDYRLHVRAANADGVGSAGEIDLPITVTPAPWKTPLAYGLYAAATVLMAWLALRGWRRRVQQRHAMDLAEQQRRAAEQLALAKSTFLADMSHEIRTPLTGVLGMAELLRTTPLDARQQGYAEAISRSGELLLRLVNDSLDLARIEAGKLVLEPRPFSPRSLVEEVAALEEGLARKKGLAMTVRCASELPATVLGDGLRIKQVLLNLVSNAIKFTEQGEVRLAANAAPEGGIEFEVTDSGPGMNADMRERLFGRFEQSRGIAPRHGGSGLGLSIARELIELMQGSIRVDSEPGRGATFRVHLPLPVVDAAEPASENEMRVASSAPDAGPRSVLVVEDDATIAGVLSGLLEARSCTVEHAAHGLAALAAITTRTFDLALIDFDLPGIDGLELARLIRKGEAGSGRSLHMVGISARSVGTEDAQSRAAGMNAFLRKPITPAMLDALLADCFAQPE